MRGLKLVFLVLRLKSLQVAPLVGAWIETFFVLQARLVPEVAPLVGAWIETSSMVLTGLLL